MAKPGHGYRYITVDGIAVSKPCNLIAVLFTPVANTDYITVYDGVDTSSGDVVLRFDAATIIGREMHVSGGIYCANGVYVDFSAAKGYCTIVYDTVETL